MDNLAPSTTVMPPSAPDTPPMKPQIGWRSFCRQSTMSPFLKSISWTQYHSYPRLHPISMTSWHWDKLDEQSVNVVSNACVPLSLIGYSVNYDSLDYPWNSYYYDKINSGWWWLTYIHVHAVVRSDWKAIKVHLEACHIRCLEMAITPPGQAQPTL